MRKAREARSLKLQQMAAATGYSISYLSDLELGQRKWNQNVKMKYLKALEAEGAQ